MSLLSLEINTPDFFVNSWIVCSAEMYDPRIHMNSHERNGKAKLTIATVCKGGGVHSVLLFWTW